MIRRGVPALRSARHWMVRGSLAALAALVGGISVAGTTAQVIRNADPERAHKLAPGDGRITALLAARRLIAEPTAAGSFSPAALARAALRQDPTAIPAVVTLGLTTQLRSGPTSARRLFAYSEVLSRRDLQTQLWSIEDAVGRGDVAGALVHYDRALRTSRTAPDLLFPVLASAIADPTVRAATIRTLVDRPGWGDAFISHVARGAGDPEVTTDFFAGLHRAGVPVFEEAGVTAMNALVARGLFERAWNYYASIHPGANPRRSRDPDFSADPKMPAPFDWTGLNDAGIITSFQRGDRGGLFDFSVSAGAGGALLRQMQVLPPGAYRLVGRSIGPDQPEPTLPYWTLTCTDGRELGRVPVSGRGQSDGLFVGRFDVPAGCPVQTLTLMARSSEAIGGTLGQIDRVQLAPVQ